jgi:hypothetical protein
MYIINESCATDPQAHGHENFQHPSRSSLPTDLCRLPDSTRSAYIRFEKCALHKTTEQQHLKNMLGSPLATLCINSGMPDDPERWDVILCKDEASKLRSILTLLHTAGCSGF